MARAFVVGWVGRTTRGLKRSSLAFNAIRKVNNARLKIAGSTSKKKLHVPHRKMPQFYGSLDCLLMTSKSEAHPLIVYEALACATPVIATNVGDVSGVIRNNYNGILLSKNCTVNQVRQALLKIKRHPEQARLMGLRGMLTIRDKWTWNKWIPSYVEMFNYVLEKTENKKPKNIQLLIIIDRRDWAWGFMAEELSRRLPKKFVSTIKTMEECDELNWGKYDIVYNHMWTAVNDETMKQIPIERMILSVNGEAFRLPRHYKLFRHLAKESACITTVSKPFISELERLGKTFYCSRGVDTNLFKPIPRRRIQLTLVFDVRGWAYYNLAMDIKNRLPSYYQTRVMRPPALLRRRFDIRSDIVYNWLWGNLNLKNKIPTEKTILGVNGWMFLQYPVEFMEATSRAAIIIANSRKIYETIRRMLPDKPVFLCHTGVDIDLFKPDFSKRPKQFTVGWIGNPNRPLKRYELAVNAVRKCESVLFRPILFDRHNNKTVRPHGEMPQYYNGLSCHLVVSNSESKSLQTHEAMACGIPVITTDVGDIKEELRDGESGIILPVNCTEAQIVAAIKRLRDNPALRRKMGNAAREAILEKAQWSNEKSVPCYLKVFEGMLNPDPV